MSHLRHGILTPLATPMLDPEQLDNDGLRRLIDHVIGGGVQGIFLLGTTGEGPNLSMRLRYQVLETAAECIDGRVALLVNVTGTSFRDNLELARTASQLGASAAVYSGPLYAPVSQSDLFGHVARFAGQSALPLFLYNMPSHTGVTIEVETVAKLAVRGHIVGVKDSSGDLMYVQKLSHSVGPDIPVFIGPEELLYPAMISAGVAGGVNGGSNLFPSLYVRLHNAARSGDHREAARLHEAVVQAARDVYSLGYLRGLKAALEASGICSTRAMAEPGVALEPAEAAGIAEFVSRFGLAAADEVNA